MKQIAFVGILMLATGAFSQNVGINNTAPRFPLDISKNDTAGVALRLRTNVGGNSGQKTFLYFTNSATNSNIDEFTTYIGGIRSGSGQHLVFGTSANGATTSERMRIDSAGHVGIGTTFAEYFLDVNGRMRLRYNGNTSGIWFNRSDNNEGGFFGHYNDNTMGFFGPGNVSSWRFGFDLPNSRLGIGTMIPEEGLHIFNRNFLMEDASSNVAIKLKPNSNANAPEILLFEDGGDSTLIIRGSDAAGQSGEIVFIDPTDNSLTLEIDGDYAGTGRSRIILDELQIKGGSDFSEYFDVSPVKNIQPLPGMIVSIDENNPGKMIISHSAYDKKVAGVISGANGIKPGMMMGQKKSIADGEYPVAITGRVYVKAETSRSEIKPGDLLTTSNIPGYAMKAGNLRKGTGAIIGKAMTSLKDAEGFVLVLLGMQ